MKLLVISDVFYPRRGGTEIIFREVFRRLAAKGFEINVLTPQIGGAAAQEEVDGVSITRIAPANRLLFIFSALRKALQEAKRSDVIHTAVWFGGYPAAFAKIASNKPCVLTANAYFKYKWLKIRGVPKALAFAAAEQFLFKLPFDRYCCLSKAQADLLSKSVAKEKIIVTYPGLDFALFKPQALSKRVLDLSDKEFIYCFYGRYDPQKGIDTLLKAAKIFFREDAKLLMIVAGDHTKIKKMINALGLEEHVLLMQGMPQQKLAQLLNAVDTVVVPSKVEPFGMVAAEASALAKPVIASAVDGLTEIVVDGKTGFLVEPQMPQAFANKLEILYNSRKLCKKLGRNGRKHVKKFSWDKTAKQYQKIYEELTL